MIFDSKAFFDTLFSTQFLWPAATTLGITLVSMMLAILLGFGGALAALSRLAALRWLVQLYLGFFRGVPVLVQIVFWYNAVPVLTNNAINLPALVAGTLALALNEGAYMTEIIRSGLISVDPGPARGRPRPGHDPGQGHAPDRGAAGAGASSFRPPATSSSPC